MLCQCCETSVGTIDCKDCIQSAPQQTPNQWMVLCEPCCTFIHRGAFKDHQLIVPALKAKRDDVKEKLTTYKECHQWEVKVKSDLQCIRKEIEEGQMRYESGIKNKITQLQQDLKRTGITMLNKIREISASKIKQLDDLINLIDTNEKGACELESKLGQLINNISDFEKEIDGYEEKLDYKFVEWDKSAFPKLSIPFKIDYSQVEGAVNGLQLIVQEEPREWQSASQEEKSEPCDVSLQSRIDSQGVFWIHVDFNEETLNQLLSISYDIRTMYMMDREWKTYDKNPEPPQIGELVYGLWNLDNKWYRGRIETVNDKHATVVFLDFGNSEKLELSAILPVTDRIVSTMPFQALECSLFPEPKELPLNVKFEFTDMIAGGPLHCKILSKTVFGEKEVTFIELVKDMPDGSQLNLAEYLNSRCQQVKTKVDMPFSSRDVRLLENPDAFSGSRKASEQSPSSSEQSHNCGADKCEADEAAHDTTEQVAVSQSDDHPSSSVGGTSTQNSEPVHCIPHEGLVNGNAMVTADDETSKQATINDSNAAATTVVPVQSSLDVIVESETTEEQFSLPYASLNLGESIQVVIDREFHMLNRDGSFWAMLHRNEEQNKEWTRFKKALNENAEKAAQCTKIMDGSLVLGQWKKKWHRAKVDSCGSTEDASNPKYKIRLIDYGTSCKINENQIRVLPIQYLSIPAQAVKLSIASEKLSQFGKDAQSNFMKLMEGKMITAEILNISGAKETCLEVGLTDNSGQEPLNIVESVVARETNRLLRLGHGETEPDSDVSSTTGANPVDAWQQDASLFTGPGCDPSVVQVQAYNQQFVDPSMQPYQHQPVYVDPVHYAEPVHSAHAGEHYPNDHPGEYRHQHRQNDRWSQRDRGGGGGWRDRDGRNYGSYDGGGQGCFRCGDPSHIIKNCPNEQQQNQRSGGRRRNRRT